ncbi:MAG: endonuclease NucS [Infirmifilum sp.]
MEEALELLKSSINKRETIILVADCEATYKGRASSKLGRGERIVLIKGDGSVVIHRPAGSTPVNYQPEGSVVTVKLDGGVLEITASRPRPAEELAIRVYRIMGLYTFKLVDNASFEMWGEERDLKKAILLAPRDILGEDLKPVEEEIRLGSAGIADVLLVDKDGNYVVVEIKKETAGVEAVYQLKRYVSRLRGGSGRRVRGILVAPGFTKTALVALEKEGLEHRRVSLERASKILRRAGFGPLL